MMPWMGKSPEEDGESSFGFATHPRMFGMSPGGNKMFIGDPSW